MYLLVLFCPYKTLKDISNEGAKEKLNTVFLQNIPTV